MNSNVFTHVYFWLLVLCAGAPSAAIYWLSLRKRAMSSFVILLMGFSLVAIAAIVVFLLQSLKEQAKLTPSVADDTFFNSEVSIALFLVPVMFCGIGINVISHVLIEHLVETRKRFRQISSDDERGDERSRE